MKDNHKTPKEHNPFNVFPDDASILSGVISSAYKEAEIQDKIRKEIRKETAIECLKILHGIGGCDASDEWSKGFDSAIDTAFKEIRERFGIDAEEALNG